mgnify:CR=1 FL=1
MLFIRRICIEHIEVFFINNIDFIAYTISSYICHFSLHRSFTQGLSFIELLFDFKRNFEYDFLSIPSRRSLCLEAEDLLVYGLCMEMGRSNNGPCVDIS